MSRRLKLFYRSGCSLCEEMQRELLSDNGRHGFQLECIDIDSDPALVAAYDHKVPVLTGADSEEICHYFLDRQALDSYFLTH